METFSPEELARIHPALSVSCLETLLIKQMRLIAAGLHDEKVLTKFTLVNMVGIIGEAYKRLEKLDKEVTLVSSKWNKFQNFLKRNIRSDDLKNPAVISLMLDVINNFDTVDIQKGSVTLDKRVLMFQNVNNDFDNSMQTLKDNLVKVRC